MGGGGIAASDVIKRKKEFAEWGKNGDERELIESECLNWRALFIFGTLSLLHKNITFVGNRNNKKVKYFPPAA